jgi:acyl-coenzyme A synthetase/AMP-(fatty) acid ligase
VAAYISRSALVAERNAVAVAIDDPTSMIYAIWGAVLTGVSVVLMPLVKDAATIERALSDAGAAMLLTDSDEQSGDAWHANVCDALRTPHLPQQPARLASARPAFLFQTSGTSGEPKWVCCEFDKCARAVHAMLRGGALDHAKGSTVFLTPPLNHSYGLSSFFEYSAAAGTIVFPPNRSPFGPAGDLQHPGEHSINALEGVPYFYSQLAKLRSRVRMPALRHIGLGGGPLDPTVVEQLLTAFPNVTVSVRYGLTETPSVVAHKVFRPPYQDDWRSSGRVVDAYSLRIENAGRACGRNEEGEIIVSGDCVANYHGQPTAELRTGDLGYLTDNDELVVVGRRSSYLKHRGFRISPELVESAIAQFPGVRDCRLVVKDSTLVAEVVCDGEVSWAEIPAFASVRLPAHAVPERIERVASIARTASGKIKRH